MFDNGSGKRTRLAISFLDHKVAIEYELPCVKIGQEIPIGSQGWDVRKLSSGQ